MCTSRNCLASRQPLLLATLRNISSLSDHQIIFQICKGLGYGISDEARICPMCPHESPHSSHAEFACGIRIEAVRTMSRIFRHELILDAGANAFSYSTCVQYCI
jgi:hypothetical protein